MLRAAFITPGAYPIPSSMGGSVERVVEKVVPGLLPHVHATIYGRIGKRLPSRGNLNGVTVERFTGANKALYFQSVRKRLTQSKPDVIQVENRPLWVPRLKQSFPHSRIWLNLHSITFINAPYLSKQQRNRCLQAADIIQVNSEFLRNYIQKKVPQAAGKIKVNHLGVDTERFPGRSTVEGMGMREHWRAKHGWGNRRIVVYVGRLVPQKGIHHLLNTLPILIANAPDVLIVIVGSAQYGSHRQTAYTRRLHKQASRWKHHVHFQPYVPHHEIPYWFVMADIAVVPSVGREAFGLVNLEAMAAELPVVATRAGGMKEVVVDGSTGFLVPSEAPGIVGELASRISNLLVNETMRKEMGRRGRERVLNHFTWRHTAERWLGFQRNSD
ncbi:glycosyltransferase family 4 protein [Cohnella herbarum]|uniref:Glycosyltransferase family 4 protein n=1 Tax=Cohnella herbarum TaxID=2728023 RepID=A0A7Z2VJA5_9BACL|nr:glycosyltransferase family 4 protein [Cohnella herbarum]QJD84084.1 glycosyltransferase family 4 protein [Cohnella herbarum]